MDSEKKLVAQNEACVKRAPCYHKNEDGRNIVIWHRFLPELLEFEINKLDNAALKDAKHIDIFLGRDHGKGACACMDIMFFLISSLIIMLMEITY